MDECVFSEAFVLSDLQFFSPSGKKVYVTWKRRFDFQRIAWFQVEFKHLSQFKGTTRRKNSHRFLDCKHEAVVVLQLTGSVQRKTYGPAGTSEVVLMCQMSCSLWKVLLWRLNVFHSCANNCFFLMANNFTFVFKIKSWQAVFDLQEKIRKVTIYCHRDLILKKSVELYSFQLKFLN